MSLWTSKNAILSDITVAQGRVPVAIEKAVGAGDKPQSLYITEETEEEFFKHCSADANVPDAPDLGLIQKMLDMVRDTNDWPIEDDPDKAVVISKFNPACTEFRSNLKNTSTPTDQSAIKQIKEKPKKRQRNVAVESILQAIEDNKIQNKEVVLRRPNDFIIKVEVNEEETPKIPELQESKEVKVSNEICENTTPSPVDKVHGWLETQTENPFPKKTSKVTLEAASIVFRKKEIVKKVDKYPKNLKGLEISPKSSSSNSGEYKPSKLANEYYLKYLERNKFKESVKDDIWTKAERKMKELDMKRRREAMQYLTSANGASQALGLSQSFEDTQNTDYFTERIVTETRINRCLELIGLPLHRDRLAGDCVVCEVMNKPKLPPTENTVGKEDISSLPSTPEESAVDKESELEQ